MKRVAVMTSGGDAPGMNACVRAFVRSAIHFGLEVYGINNGFKGLSENDLFLMDNSSVSDIINRGGTKLGTARFEKLVGNEEVAKELADILKSRGIEGLFVIGGDGSYRGAYSLSKYGIKIVCAPGTIDNDIASTDLTIGFDTALNTVVEAIDKLRDTSTSHQRCSIVEVMGRHCGDLALYAGLANGAEMIITPENKYSIEEVTDLVSQSFKQGKRHFLIVITENVLDTQDLAAYIVDNTEYDARTTVLGHIQRGGKPSALDRFIATKLGYLAAYKLNNGKTDITLGTDGHIFYETPMAEAMSKIKQTNMIDYQINEVIK